jgi:hypothetical protein
MSAASRGKRSLGARLGRIGLIAIAVVAAFAVAFVSMSIVQGSHGGKTTSLGGESVNACPSTLIGALQVDSVAVRTRPDPSSNVIGRFRRMTEFGVRQVFALKAPATGQDGALWYRAMLPIVPNGSEGFVPADTLQLSRSSYRLVVDRASLHLSVYKDCQLLKRYLVGIGKPSTPTPAGKFYLTGLFKPPTGSAYGAYAYSLSAFSEVLTDWPLGGIVGLHGTNDPSSIGKPDSHGCIRMWNADITEIASMVPVGTPIEID